MFKQYNCDSDIALLYYRITFPVALKEVPGTLCACISALISVCVYTYIIYAYLRIIEKFMIS